jgi:hypothetical protein
MSQTTGYKQWISHPVGLQTGSEETKGPPGGGPKLLWFTEAPVGIEPTNGGFAVLGELLQSFMSFPKLLHDRALAHLHTTADS